MISRPTQLPEIRIELLQWLVKNGAAFFTACIKDGRMPIRPNLDDDKAGRYLAQQEAKRLASAELFWVDESMTDLTLAAAATMPDFNILPEDLPSPSGLIVFEKTLRQKVTPDYGDITNIRAAAWGPVPPMFPWEGIWVSWYTDTALNLESVSPRRVAAWLGIPEAKAKAKTKALPSWRGLGFPSFAYENEDLIPFSENPLPSFDSTSGEPMDEADYPQKELVTAWTLMQQPIAKVSDAEYDRAARRRLERAKIEPKPVRVVTLRRPKSASEHGSSDREYHHQWIVRGHWRQQWYPARQVHRPVWIAPHIKGPEDAPLLGGDKVHAWRR